MKPPTRTVQCPDCRHEMSGYSWQLVEAAVAHEAICGGIMRRVLDLEPEPTPQAIPPAVEDALWLLDQGESPHEAAKRVGKSIAALDIALRRAGIYRRDVLAAAQQTGRRAA